MNVPFLTTLAILKACNLLYTILFQTVFVLHSFEVILSLLIEKSRQKAIEKEIAFFSFPWESQGAHIGSFLLCFTYPS